MRNFYGNLTLEERQVLAIVSSEYLEEILTPIIYGEFMEEAEIAGENVRLISKKMKSSYDDKNHKKAQEIHGESYTLTENGLNNLKSYAVMPTEHSRFARSENESQGLMLVSRVTGTIQAFDSPVDNDSAVELSLSFAEFSKSSLSTLDDDADDYMSNGVGINEILMSPEQYIRFVRTDGIDIPCTIVSNNGQRNDVPPVFLKTQTTIDENLREDIKAVISPLGKQADVVLGLLASTATGKKAMANLRAEVAKLNKIYENIHDDLGDTKVQGAKDTMEQFAKELNAHIAIEAKRLSPASQAMLPLFDIKA